MTSVTFALLILFPTPLGGGEWMYGGAWQGLPTKLFFSEKILK